MPEPAWAPVWVTGATSPRSAAPPLGETVGVRGSARTRRGRPSVRLVIVGWVLLLTAGVLTLVTVASRQALLAAVDEQVTETLAREAAEFTLATASGVDQATGRPFDDARQLLVTHLQRQSPDDDEILFGVADPAPGAARSTPVRQADEPPYDVSADPVAVARILAATQASGSVPTPHGELRWEKRRATTATGAGAWFVTGYFVDRDRAEVFDAMRTLVLFSLLGLVLAGCGAWLVSGRILAPVRLVRSVAAEIGEHDLSRRIDVRGRDDMAALAEQFNAMLDRLQAASVAQNRFVDAASHELRTPLTIVRGNLELLPDDPVERAETVRLATDEVDRMARIVEDLLVLSQSQRPDFLRPRPVSVADLTCDCVDDAQRPADRRWRVQDVGEGRAVLDPHRVRAALRHLTRNAAQHTPGDAEIRVGSAVTDRTVRFWVADDGPGVPPDRIESIFDRFSRGVGSGPRAEGTGAGLGLAVVRAVAEAHGGSVAVRPGRGGGAEFVLELPLDGPPVG